MRRKTYTQPTMEFMEVRIEQGIATSPGSGASGGVYEEDGEF